MARTSLPCASTVVLVALMSAITDDADVAHGVRAAPSAATADWPVPAPFATRVELQEPIKTLKRVALPDADPDAVMTPMPPTAAAEYGVGPPSAVIVLLPPIARTEFVSVARAT